MFVPRTAPGDLVELAAGARCTGAIARARAGRLLEPSADRVEPRCPHYVTTSAAAASSSTWTPAAQREARRGFVGDALRRIGRLDVADPEIVPAGEEFEYRTKITLAVDAGGGRIGLHPLDRPDRVFDLVRCHITSLRADGALGARSARCAGCSLQPLRQMVLRLDRGGGLHLVLVPGGRRSLGWRRVLPRRWRARGADGDRLAPARGGEAVAVAGATVRSRRRCSSRCTRRWATGSAPSRSPRSARSRGRHVWDLYAGIGETTVRPGAGRRHRSRASSPIRRAVAEAEARGPAGGAPRRAGGDGPRPAPPAGAGDHQPAAHRHGRAGGGGAGAPARRRGSSTSPAIRRRWRGT